MKCVVMETNGRNAVVLNDSGDFVRVRNRHYESGQRIVIQTPRLRRFRLAASAAVGALVLSIAAGAYAYAMPYSEVSLDVNPSIVMKLNCFDRVIDVTPMNEDAGKIVNNLELINENIDTATGEVVAELSAQGYINSKDEAEIMVTVTSRDQKRAQEMLKTTEKKIEQKTEQLCAKASVFGECVGQELVAKAREYDVSPGKLMLVEKYAISTGDPVSVNVADWLDKPVKEIMAATKENRKAAKGAQDNRNSGKGKAVQATPSPTVSPDSTAGKNGLGKAGKPVATSKGYVKSNGHKYNKYDSHQYEQYDKNYSGSKRVKPTAAPRVSPRPSPACTKTWVRNKYGQ